GNVDPVIGRDKEIERVIQVLSRRTKNNPVLIGEPGVGKTAVAEGLAHQIINNEIQESLRDKRVLTLDIVKVVSGTIYLGVFVDQLFLKDFHIKLLIKKSHKHYVTNV